MTWAGDQFCAELVEFGILVVAEHGNHNAGVFVQLRGVVHRDWGRVQHIDADRCAGLVAQQIAIAGLVGEAVRTQVAQFRRIGDGAVGIDCHRPMRGAGTGDQHWCERIAFDVGVVDQYRDRHAAVAHHVGRVVDSHRGVVHRGDVQRGTAGGGEVAVSDGVAEADRAVVVQGRGVGPGAITVVNQAAVAAVDGQTGGGEADAVDVSRVAQ